MPQNNEYNFLMLRTRENNGQKCLTAIKNVEIKKTNSNSSVTRTMESGAHSIRF